MRYYEIDFGHDMTEYAEIIVNDLKDKGHHTITFDSVSDSTLIVKEVTQDEFLNNFDVDLI